MYFVGAIVAMIAAFLAVFIITAMLERQYLSGDVEAAIGAVSV